jgi:hypothetical protein
MTYIINGGTGAINEIEAANLEEAKAIADKGACYTQKDYWIEDKEGNELARRGWWGVAYDEEESDDENPICFGTNGYYSDWTE